MIKKQYALLDHVAGIFLNPLTFLNDAEAIRWFTTTVNDTKTDTMVNQHPEGYSLYRLADYDDQTGMYQPRDLTSSVDPSQEPKLVITGINVLTEDTTTTLDEIKKIIEDIINK